MPKLLPVPPRIAQNSGAFTASDAFTMPLSASITSASTTLSVHPVLAGGEPEAAALHVAADADVLAAAARHVEPIVVERGVQMAEIRAGADHGTPLPGIDDDVREPADVDHQAVVDRESGGAVA